MVNRIGHYALENPASIYDEEALTALELAGRTAQKVNECVDEVNTIPAKITDEVQNQIDNGTFEDQINRYAGDLKKQVSDTKAYLSEQVNDCKDTVTEQVNNCLDTVTDQVSEALRIMNEELDAQEARLDSDYETLESSVGTRLDNLLGKVTTGSTSMDSEVIDIRAGVDGKTYTNAGTAVRTGLTRVNQIMGGCFYVGYSGTIEMIGSPSAGRELGVKISNPLVALFYGLKAELPWAEVTSNIADATTISEDGNECTITIKQNRQSLVFSTLNNKFYIRACDNLKYGDFVMLVNSWGEAVGGWMYDKWISQNATKRIEEIKTNVVNLASGWGYVGNSGNVNITIEGEFSNVTVAREMIFLFHGIKKEYAWRDITSNLDNTRYSIDGDAITVKVGNRQNLVFNINDEQLYLRQGDDNEWGDYLLLGNGWGNPSGGLLFDLWMERRLDKLEGSLNEDAFNVDSNTIQTYGARFNGLEKVEPFLFFTDPHLCQKGETWEPLFHKYMELCGETYNQSGANLVFCGGDWLGNSDSQGEACYKLGYINGRMHEMFGDKYIPILGNHDTNYQGYINEGESNTGTLTPATINNLYFRDRGSSYYTVYTRNTCFIVLDTGTEWDASINDERMAQLGWLAKHLQDFAYPGNIVIMAHIFTPSTNATEPTAFMEQVTKMCKAFNERRFFSYEGMGADFANCSGKVRFLMAGHAHKDTVMVHNEIPVIITTKMREGSTPTFDLCLADYDNGILYLDRIGSGESRTVNI